MHISLINFDKLITTKNVKIEFNSIDPTAKLILLSSLRSAVHKHRRRIQNTFNPFLWPVWKGAIVLKNI